MKKSSKSIISVYYNAILAVLKNDAVKIQVFLMDLNGFLIAVRNLKINLNRIKKDSFSNILSQTSLEKSTINILQVIIKNERFDILPILFERLLQKLSHLTNQNIVQISCGDFKKFDEIKALPLCANSVVFYSKTYNKTNSSDEIAVKINNKIVDISVKSKINNLRNQVVKNIENLVS